jgi:hypothetical protein
VNREEQDTAVRTIVRRMRAAADAVEQSLALHSIDQAFALGDALTENDAIRSEIDSAREVAYALCAPGAA